MGSIPAKGTGLLYMKQNAILISGAIVFREGRGKRQFLLVKVAEGVDNWEIPKVTVRRGESSVRAVIRMTSEQAGINARVLEEAGRTTGTIAVGGKPVSQKFYYYLMVLKSAGEILSFAEYKWLEYIKAVKMLSNKKEQTMLKSAKEVLAKLEKAKGRQTSYNA